MNRSKLTLTVGLLVASLWTVPVAAQRVELGWLDRFDGEAHYNDYALALELDGEGDLYAVGFSFIEQSPGYFTPRYLTIKYAPDGSRIWARTWDIGLRSDGSDLALDADDNVIVTGSVGNSDWGTIKYDPAGNLLWSTIFVTTTPFVEGPTAVDVDGAGNIYVTGPESDLGSSTTIKYDPDGEELWTRRHFGPAGSSYPRALAVSDRGDVYVAGSVYTTDRSVEFSVIKYDDDGNLAWEQRFGALNTQADDVAEDVVIDDSGAIVVSGYFGANSVESTDVATYRLAPDGTVLWSDRYGDPARGRESGARVGVDSLGNVVVAATSEDDSFVGDLLLLKYSPAGELLWERLWDGGTGEYDFATAVAVDDSDRVYVAGSGGWYNYFAVVKYDGAGNVEWRQTYEGSSGGSIAWDVVVGPGRGAYVTGESDSFLDGVDIVTARYDQPALLGPPEPGLPGETSTLSLAGAREGERVFFVASTARGSSAVPGCTDTTLDLGSLVPLGSAVTDAQGLAALEITLPAQTTGRTIYLQAVVAGTCAVSNRVTYTVP